MKCPACGHDQILGTQAIADREYALDAIARFAECAGCRTLYQEPMPSESQLAAFYPPEYHSFHSGGALARLRHELRLRRLTALARTATGPWLDYGCGNGAFLMHAAARFPDRTFFGFESAERREALSLAPRVTLLRGDLPWLLESIPACGVVTLNHVVEHLPDPRAVVTALRLKLTPGAFIEGQTPAADSLERRVFGTRWSGYHAPRHTVVFSRAGLTELLEESGFEKVRISPAFNPAGLAVSLAALRRPPGPGRIRRQGIGWLTWLGLGTALAPIDRFSGAPGIVDFSASVQ